MFRCDVCGSVAPSNTRCNRLVVETRPVDYPARDRVYRKPRKRRTSRKDKWLPDPGGHGAEIVREVRACDDCVAEAPQSSEAMSHRRSAGSQRSCAAALRNVSASRAR